MIGIGDLYLKNPEFLLLLLLIPAIGIYFFLRKPDRSLKMLLPSLKSLDGISSWRGKLLPLLPILRTLAFTLFVIALARPQLVLKEEEITADGIDIMMAMDVSTSMLNTDFAPSRIEVSKSLAVDFISKRKYDRIGLVVFAGESFTQCPLTTDHRVVQNFIKSLQCGMLEDGTAIGMGLASAVNRLKESEVKSKIVILLTDGVNTGGYIDPQTAADIAQEFDIKVYTIGIGRGGFFGKSIDEKLLNEIAKQTGGQYFRAKSESALLQIYDYIDNLEKTEININSFKRYSEEYRKFFLWGLILLGLEFIFRKTILRTFP